MRVEAPIVSVTLTLANGDVIERTWTEAELDNGSFPTPALLDHVDWLEDRHRVWGHPLDPVALTARVPAGREQDARRLLS